MVLLQDWLTRLQADDPEERQIISGVSWEQYEELLLERGDTSTYRITYLDRILEFMSPSRRHEDRKTNIGSLLEDYFKAKRIRYFPMGSTTLRNQIKRGGAEPDESYCIGTNKEFPDLVIEVVVTSGSIDKLEVYRRLQIQEVWFFKTDHFEVHHLRETGYEQVGRSEILPDLDLDLLAKYAVADDPLDAALEFRQKIQSV